MDEDLIAVLFVSFVLIAFIVFVGVLAWFVIDFIFGLLNAPFYVKIAVWLLFMLWFVRPRVEKLG